MLNNNFFCLAIFFYNLHKKNIEKVEEANIYLQIF